MIWQVTHSEHDKEGNWFFLVKPSIEHATQFRITRNTDGAWLCSCRTPAARCDHIFCAFTYYAEAQARIKAMKHGAELAAAAAKERRRIESEVKLNVSQAGPLLTGTRKIRPRK